MNTKLATALIVGALALPVAAHSADSAKEMVKDSVITTKIKADYAADKVVSAMKIHVDTDANGMVQLTGTAKSQAEVDKAVAIAKGVKGVTSVQNNIKIGAAK